MNNAARAAQRRRDPNGGCPWDVEQNFRTIAPYTIEEAYEVLETIDHRDTAKLKEELGDEWLKNDLFRFGASSLLTDIERQLYHYLTGHYAAKHHMPMG